MADVLRRLQFPTVITCIVVTLWAYARAQSLSREANQGYYPALMSVAAQPQPTSRPAPLAVEAEDADPAVADVTPAGSSRTR